MERRFVTPTTALSRYFSEPFAAVEGANTMVELATPGRPSWLRRNTLGRLPMILFLALLPFEFVKMAFGREPTFGKPLPFYQLSRTLLKRRRSQ